MNPSNDIAILYAGWPAQSVVWIPRNGQGRTRRAIFNQPGADIFDGVVQLTDASLQYPSDSFPNVRQGDRFIVDGHTWIASAPALPSRDGSESVVPVAKAGS